ncbi:15-cis-phytoene synthase / lycopene beta-cyclase, partial [Phenoliferia sp. Uapishka_3]
MPAFAILTPILFPTLYLWLCDALALQRGTWVIESGTKFGISAFGLEIEEAIFFLLTNVLVVFGTVAIDFTMAVHDLCATTWGLSQQRIGTFSVIQCIIASPDKYPQERLGALRDAADIVRRKSRSFWTASFVFEGPLKLDLLSLYAWCRCTDDFIDEAPDAKSASALLNSCHQFLSATPSPPALSSPDKKHPTIAEILLSLPTASRTSFTLLATLPIPHHPLEELLSGYKSDISFFDTTLAPTIRTDAHLLHYAENVASSVAELCVILVWAHGATPPPSPKEQEEIIRAARTMGQALQIVNIVRDVEADAKVGRCYLPGILACDIVEGRISMRSLRGERLRLLSMAEELANQSRPSISRLPDAASGPMRAACDIYLAIGERVRERMMLGLDEGRASLSKWTRIRAAWKAMKSYA